MKQLSLVGLFIGLSLWFAQFALATGSGCTSFMATAEYQPELIKAIAVSDVQKVATLLQNGANVETLSRSGATALAVASEVGSRDIVQLLLNAGAQVHPKTFQAPLYAAAGAGHLEIVKDLIEAGANVNYDGYKVSRRPLHAAASMGRTEIVRYLISKGAQVNAIEWANGRSAIHDAAASHKIAILEILLKSGANINQYFQGTPLYHAIWTSDAKYSDGIDRHKAALETVKFLLEHGADPNIGCEDAYSPFSPLREALGKKDRELVFLLVENGAKIEWNYVDMYMPELRKALTKESWKK